MQWFLRFLAHEQSVVKRKDPLGNINKGNAQKNQVTCVEAIWESWFGKLCAGTTGKFLVMPMVGCKSNHFSRLMEENLKTASCRLAARQLKKSAKCNIKLKFTVYSTRWQGLVVENVHFFFLFSGASSRCLFGHRPRYMSLVELCSWIEGWNVTQQGLMNTSILK